MAIYKSPRGSWRFDYSINGQRKRRDFKTKATAEAFEREFILRREFAATGPTVIRKSLSEAMKWYHSTISVSKETQSAESEKHYFAVLFECLRSNSVIGLKRTDFQLEFINEVELSHLRAIQTYLSNYPTHGICKAHERQRQRGDPQADQKIVATFTTIAAPKQCEDKDPKTGETLTCRASVLSPSSVNRMFNTWKDFFNQCDQNGWLQKNPALYLKGLPETPKTKVVHSDETVQRLIDEAAKLGSSGEERFKYWNDIGDALWFLAKTGARPCEVKRLSWSDIDFENAEIRFRSIKGKRSVNREKTRTLPMTDEIAGFMRNRYLTARSKLQIWDRDRVFSSAQGGDFNSKAFARSVGTLCERTKIKDFTAYCLRHGFVTRARRAGISIDTAGDIVGHSNRETTRKIYSHMTGDDLRPAMGQIGRALNIVRRN